MTLEEQLEFLREHAQQAFDDALAFMIAHRQAIIDAMPVRLIGGFPEYGDNSWQATPEEIRRGMFEEAVDLPNYATFLIYLRMMSQRYVVLPEPSTAPDD